MKENSQEASADPAPTDRRVIRDDHPATELPGGLRAKGNPQAPRGGDVRYRHLYKGWY